MKWFVASIEGGSSEQDGLLPRFKGPHSRQFSGSFFQMFVAYKLQLLHVWFWSWGQRADWNRTIGDAFWTQSLGFVLYEQDFKTNVKPEQRPPNWTAAAMMDFYENQHTVRYSLVCLAYDKCMNELFYVLQRPQSINPCVILQVVEGGLMRLRSESTITPRC